jgi:hypothetical protein
MRQASLQKENHMSVKPDLLVRNEGTLFLFCPLTAGAKSWIDAHLQPDAQWFGNALVVEHRFAWDWLWASKTRGW